MTNDPFDLSRFVAAQHGVHDRAVAELRGGAKTGHWMWFVFPQIAGLGHSEMARRYAIRSLDEARAYLTHPVLGSRLRETTQTAMASGKDARDIFGVIDAMKLRSSLTLFVQAGGDAPFRAALDHFFGGQPDPETERLLGR